MGAVIPAGELLTAYEPAYSLIGNYCGGGEQKIRAELTAVARVIFRRAGLI